MADLGSPDAGSGADGLELRTRPLVAVRAGLAGLVVVHARPNAQVRFCRVPARTVGRGT